MIVQIQSFDYLTSSPSRLVASGGLWAALPRLTRGVPMARLFITADALQPADVLDGFYQVATPERYLPPGVMAYRIAYEDHLRATVREVRYTRLYLALDTDMEQEALLNLLGAYSIPAQVLDHELPRPFQRAVAGWETLEAEDGRHLAVLRSRYNQYGGIIHPQTLHNLLAQEFPLWIVLQIYTYTQPEAMRLLRLKGAMALYSQDRNEEARQEASTAAGGVQAMRDALARGEALHAVSLYVVVDGRDRETVNHRATIVQSTAGLEMERLYGTGTLLADLFSAEIRASGGLTVTWSEGTPLTTGGVALLVGSALSYRRRTETRGVMLGIDRNQSPVVLNLFNDRNPSYNTVILGQTGSGKTFATLLLMMRHLLMGVRLIIVDPQGNIDLPFLGPEVYQRNLVGTSRSTINVLDVVHEEFGSQVELALSMLRMLGIWREGEASARALLDASLVSLYEPVWGKGEESPTLADLQGVLRKTSVQTPAMQEVRDCLEAMLEIYVRGSQREMFRRTSIDFGLDHALTVFDVSRLPQQGMAGGLRSAFLSILVANINQGIRRRRMRGDRAPILFFVDEMGILMRDAVMAEYISSEYKTARARLVGMIVADQDLHSLLGPRDEKGLHHGIPMLANAANTLIFNQKDSERARVREYFPGLPEVLVDALPILPRGTCVASLPDDLLVVNVVPTQLERIVFSSRLQDREKARYIVQQLQAELEVEG